MGFPTDSNQQLQLKFNINLSCLVFIKLHVRIQNEEIKRINSKKI